MRKPFHEWTKEEQMAELMGTRKERRYDTRKWPLPPPPKKRGPKGPRKRAAPLSSSHHTKLPAEKQCESIPVKQALQDIGIEPMSELEHVVPASYLNQVRGGFGAEEVAGKPVSKHHVRGRRPHIPWDMFSHTDIAEYAGVAVRKVIAIGGMLGYMKRIPGTKFYAPLSRSQAKAILHHIVCVGGRRSPR